jgi:hypothetical protein
MNVSSIKDASPGRWFSVLRPQMFLEILPLSANERPQNQITSNQIKPNQAISGFDVAKIPRRNRRMEKVSIGGFGSENRWTVTRGHWGIHRCSGSPSLGDTREFLIRLRVDV